LLHEFVTKNRAEIIARARARIGSRIAPLPTEAELEQGVGLFLDDLLQALAPAPAPARSRPGLALRRGFTVAQVVYDFGDICQTITELVSERDAPLDAHEFRILNQSLDDAIASAVSEFSRRHDHETREQRAHDLTLFADQLRPLIAAALLAFEMVQKGAVGAGGSTGALVGRSLWALRRKIDSTLAVARLDRGAAIHERVVLADVVEELEVSASIEAKGRGVRLAMDVSDRALVVDGDREILSAALNNVLEAAIQGTSRGGQVTVTLEQHDSMVRLVVSTTGVLDGEGDGLAVARRAVGACGGVVEIFNSTDLRRCTIALPTSPLLS
jgi:signal transduction histidine kinase